MPWDRFLVQFQILAHRQGDGTGHHAADQPLDDGLHAHHHSIHNYFYPLRIRPNVRTVALSEYGGIAWPMPGHEPPRKTYGYGTARSRAELTERYCDLQRKTVLPQLKKGLSALVYTQLTDVEDEVNGLFTYDRTAIKPDAAAVRAVNEALEAEFEKAVKA